MKRIAILAIAVLSLTGCAQAGTRYTLSPVTLTVPASDNAAPSCDLAPVLIAVPDTTLRVVYLRVTQASWSWSDSLVTYASRGSVTFAPAAPPAGTVCTLEAWARDRAGDGCRVTATRVPVAVTVYPARVSINP
jgi:hypothetical protein